MGNPITNKQITGGKDPFEDLSKGAKASLELLNAVEKSLKKTAEIVVKLAKEKPFKNFKSLQDSQKAITKLAKTTKQLDGVEQARLKLLKKLKEASSDRIQKNVELQVQLKEQNKINLELAKTALKVNEADEKNIKAKIKLQAASKEQKDALKDLIILEDKQAGTLAKLEAKNRILRRERAKLNTETEKGKKRLTEINKALDKNNKKINENSDKLKKQKLNVGGYTTSIKEAAGASGLFGGILGKLSQIQATANALLLKNTIEQEASTAAKITNASATKSLTLAQRAYNLAVGLGSKGLKIFKAALAGTGIGILLIALGALVAFFTRAQDAVDGVSVGMAGLGAAIDVLIDRMSLLGRGIVQVFKGIPDTLRGFVIRAKIELLKLGQIEIFGTKISDNTQDIRELRDELEGLSGVGDGIELIKKAFEGIGDEIAREIALASELKKLTIDLTREQKLFEAELAKSVSTTTELRAIVLNKLNDDQLRLTTVKEIAKIELELSEKQLNLSKQALAASLDSISADRQRLELGAEQLKFIERIKNGQIGAAEAVKLAADFTLSSAAGEEALFEIVDKVVELERSRTSLLNKRATTEKRIGSITKEIATKDAKALLLVSKAFVKESKDREVSFERRREAAAEAADFEIRSSQVQVDANVITVLEGEQRIKDAHERRRLALDKINKDIIKDRQRAIAIETSLIENEFDKRSEIELQKSDTLVKEILDSRLLGEKEKSALIIAERERLANALLEIERSRIKQEIDDEGALAEALINQKRSDFETEEDFEKFKQEELLKIKEAALNKELDLLEAQGDERNNLRIEQIKGELAILKDGLDKEGATEKEKAEERKEIILGVIDAVSEATEQANEKRIKALDDEIAATVTRQQELLQKANEGVLGAEESLATEQAKNAKLKLAKKKEEQEQELFSAFLELLTAGIEAGKTPAEAFQNAGSILAAAPAFVKTIPGLYEGTDGKKVSEVLGKPHLNTSKDAYLSRLDGDEIVLDGKDSSLIPKGMTGQEIGKAAQQAHYNKTNPQNATRFVNDPAMIEKLVSIEKAINSQPKIEAVDYDIVNQIINQKIRQNNKIINKQSKLSRLV